MMIDSAFNFSITYATVPTSLEPICARGVLWQASENRFLLDLPDVARYLTENGSSITVEPAPGSKEEAISYFMRMLPLGALVYQQGLLALHAAAACKGDSVILLAGDSGSGKSTLLALLLQQGWQMLADELTIVGLDDSGYPIIYPLLTGIALWPETMGRLGIDANDYPFCDANRRMYVPQRIADATTRRLSAIYRLSVATNNEVELKGLSGSSCFHAIGNMLYHSQAADIFCRRTSYFCCASAIARQVPIRLLRRPRGSWSLDELAKLITAME